MRYDPIPNRLFADRRSAFMARMKRRSAAIFFSPDRMPRSGDQSFPFHQNTDLMALSGLQQEGSILVLHPAAKRSADRQIAFILPPNRYDLIWNGRRMTPNEARQISGIHTIYTIKRWHSVLHQILLTTDVLYVNGGDPAANHVAAYASAQFKIKELQQAKPELNIISAQSIMAHERMIKHPVELQLLAKAIQVTHNAFEDMLGIVQPGRREFELEAALTQTIIAHGCQHAFEPIIASGAAACALHYVRNDGWLKKGQLTLIDFGASYAGMNADVTRTIPVSGRYTTRQADVYDAVHRVLDGTTDVMRSGITLAELNDEAGNLMDQELIRLRLATKKDIRSQDKKHPFRKKYFMHGIGHHLGWDVHDPHVKDAKLKPGMVLTCEPGLYIAKEKLGIRLENDIRITYGKPEILTQSIPIDRDEIEDRMNP
jgi:Xaa-Pro aminopeptidase